MNIRDLKLFVAVVRAGGFSSAARNTGLDPSQVSRRMAALERSLDCHLFERATRRFRVTEAGLRYLEHLEPLLDELDQHSIAFGFLVNPSAPAMRHATGCLAEKQAFGCCG